MLATCVTPADAYCVFSTYGTPPESPDGSHLTYTCFPAIPQTDGKVHRAELWLCDRDGGDRRHLADLRNIDPHNGARVDWIDAQTLLHFDDLHVVVRRLDGTVLHRIPGYPGEQVADQRVLVFHPYPTPAGEGVWLLDLTTNRYRQVVSEAMIAPFVSAAGTMLQQRPWKFTHPRFSPDGRRIGFLVNEAFFSLELDTAAAPVLLGPAPMHWLWYDATSIYGHTSSWGLGTRYSLTGEVLEVLSGLGNHLGIAPNRQWFASETDYGSDPIDLRLYARGDQTGRLVFSSPFGQAVWNNGKAHVNPAFSRDSTRLYYVKPVGPNLVQGFWSPVG